MSKRILVSVIALQGLIGCSTLGPKAEVTYHRDDINTQTTRLLIMPVTDLSGAKSDGAKSVELAIAGNWKQLYDKATVIPAGPAIEQLTKNSDAYGTLLKSMDGISIIEQLHKNPTIREFLGKVTSITGNTNLAFAIVAGGPKEFDAGKPAQINLGLFDTKNLTWKWITKIAATKGPIGNWQATSNMMISNSFDKAKEFAAEKP